MRILLIHSEAKYFAGAEAMLIYFLEGLVSVKCEAVVAVAKESKLARLIPSQLEQIRIPDNHTFSISCLIQQMTYLVQYHRVRPFDLVHGWAARDWELTSLFGRRTRRPTVGTLHDHPKARFISWKRRCLMRWCARWGLHKVACVSEAVRSACLLAGYPGYKLDVIHNGLPTGPLNRNKQTNSHFRFGFLGTFSERKGFHMLFAIVAELARLTDAPWELHVAGSPQDPPGEKILSQIHERYSQTVWWTRIHWPGWIETPTEFLKSLDLLIVPSVEFDPFPTVLLEAASVGVPAMATDVGGVPEIVDHEGTGWLFDPGDSRAAAQILRRAVEHPECCRRLGAQAMAKAIKQFTVGKMVAQYLNLYSTLFTDV
jgi:glycosyltransferase involved in cell wall biosynthesis